jgi:DNA repair ATPase RecN
MGIKIQQVVLNKLYQNKTKLSKIDDLETLVEQAEEIRENWDESLTVLYQDLFQISDRFNNVKDLYNVFMSDVDTIKSNYESVKADLGELGVEASNIPYTNDIESFINRSDDVYTEMIEAYGTFDKIKL